MVMYMEKGETQERLVKLSARIKERARHELVMMVGVAFGAVVVMVAADAAIIAEMAL